MRNFTGKMILRGAPVYTPLMRSMISLAASSPMMERRSVDERDARFKMIRQRKGVKPYQRNILGDAQAHILQGAESANGHQVIVRYDRGRRSERFISSIVAAYEASSIKSPFFTYSGRMGIS